MRQPMRIAATVLMALTTALVGASSASATTLEIGGVAKNAEVVLETSIAPGGSFLETDTFGATINTCTSSTMKWHTSSPFTVADPGTIGGPITSLSWSNCAEGNPTVDAAGTLTIQHIGSTTNGTVRWSGLKLTTPSLFGTLTCTTSGTDIGTLTGVAKSTEHAKFDFSAVIPCTVIGTAKWSGTYTVTTPTGLSVTS